MVRRPTIIDVAREAGVSKSTVSLVLRQSPLVKAATRRDVEAAMDRLGYVRNRSAAALRGGGAGLVGLVINDLRNPFFAEFAASAQMELARAGYATVIANTDEDPDVQASVTLSMLEHGVAALLVCSAFGPEVARVYDRIDRSGIPTLQVLRMGDPRTGQFPFAAPDYREGGGLAARHLRTGGARRPVFAGGLESRPVTAERVAGFRDGFAEAGVEVRHLAGRPTRAFGRELALGLERGTADAILAFNDLVALGLLSGFAERGIVVGEEIRIVGFDDIEEARFATPPLSSVACDIPAFGAAAARDLAAWLETGARPDPERRMAVRLQVRASSAS